MIYRKQGQSELSETLDCIGYAYHHGFKNWVCMEVDCGYFIKNPIIHRKNKHSNIKESVLKDQMERLGVVLDEDYDFSPSM